jgi:hypothetical protein
MRTSRLGFRLAGRGYRVYRPERNGEISRGSLHWTNPDRRIIGNSNPRYSFGIQHGGVNYKNYSLSIFFQE